MKASSLLSIVPISLFLLLSCQKDAPMQSVRQDSQAVTLSKPEQIALQLINQTGWEINQDAALTNGSQASLKKMPPACLPQFQRQPISGNIVHYKFQIPTGTGPYDMIGIHRVVKEERPFQPKKTAKNLFLQHGDAKDFEGMFLPGTRSSHTPDDFGLAIFLAQNDVDVWGIDQAWTLVPENETDFSYMADWGIQRQVEDLRTAMAVAYFSRLLTGCGWLKLNLLGYSSGVWTGYALLNEETQMPARSRLAGGFIAADGAYKSLDENYKNGFLVDYNATKAMLDQGQYGYWIPFATIARLARSSPDAESPVFPGFTNMQAAMYYAAGPIFGTITFHYFAGIWENDFPVDLQYVTKDEYFDFMEAGTPWETTRFINEYEAITCEIGDSPFDDHLGAIEVPILNLSPAGGFGELSKYTTTLLASTDITHVMPTLHPPEEVLLDFAHIDLFIAHNAQELVWQPILDWIEAHTPSPFTGQSIVAFQDKQ